MINLAFQSLDKKMTNDEFAVLNDFCAVIADAFAASSYPESTFSLKVNGLTMQIRIPPSYPPREVAAVAGDFTKLALKFPCIEQFELDEDLQRCGIFTKIVNLIGRKDGVRSVVIGNVINDEFAASLARKCCEEGSGWSVYPSMSLPCFAFTAFSGQANDS